MSSIDGSNPASGDSTVSGFLCPECMQRFVDSNTLVCHFEDSHSSLNIQLERGERKSATVNAKGTDFSSAVENQAPENLLDELLSRNTELLDYIESNQSRISELEAIINLILHQTPIPDWLKINDVGLKQKVGTYLDYQTQLASSASSIEQIQKCEPHEVSPIQTTDFAMQFSPEMSDQTIEVEIHHQRDEELVTDLLKSNQKLTLECDNVRAENVSLLEKIDSREREIEMQNSNFTEQRDNLMKQLRAVQSESNDHKTFISVLEGQLSEMRIKNHTLMENSERINTQRITLTSELDELKVRAEQTKMEANNEIELLNDKVNKLSFNHEILQNSYSQLQQDNCVLKDNLSNSELTIEQLRKELAAFEGHSQAELALSKQIDSLMGKLISVEDTNSRLEEQLRITTHEADELRTAMLELGRENQTLQVLRERTISRQWAKDDDALNCSLCKREFSLSTRKHHCRNCGEIFCQTCSAYRAPIASSKDLVRVCQPCYKELIDNQ